MSIIYQHTILREDLRNNPGVIYVFGDNADRTGFGGQAREMRGEPNALGIVTKRKPTYDQSAFYTDDMFDEWLQVAAEDLNKLMIVTEHGGHRTVVFPSYGIGTGRARLAQMSPKIFEYLNTRLSALGIRNGVNNA